MISVDESDLADQQESSYDNEHTFEFKLKSIIPLVFPVSVIFGPSLAWVWREGCCSKDKLNLDVKTEQVEGNDA